MKTAVLIDGSFFRKSKLLRDNCKRPTGKELACLIERYCLELLNFLNKYKSSNYDLYRIFYYDCLPAKNNVVHILTNESISIKDSYTATLVKELLKELGEIRNLSLRLGTIAEEQAQYRIRQSALRELIDCKLLPENLDSEKHFFLDITQKGVDTKLAIDIATLVYKKQVDQIILLANDSDFAPATRLAQDEGVEVIVDSLGEKLKLYFLESIDWRIPEEISNDIMKKSIEAIEKNPNEQEFYL